MLSLFLIAAAAAIVATASGQLVAQNLVQQAAPFTFNYSDVAGQGYLIRLTGGTGLADSVELSFDGILQVAESVDGPPFPVLDYPPDCTQGLSAGSQHSIQVTNGQGMTPLFDLDLVPVDMDLASQQSFITGSSILEITNGYVSVPGGAQTLRMQFRRQGSAAAPFSTTIRLELGCPGSGGDVADTIVPLAAGSEVELEYTIGQGLQVGQVYCLQYVLLARDETILSGACFTNGCTGISVPTATTGATASVPTASDDDSSSASTLWTAAVLFWVGLFTLSC